jgi:membrane protein
MNKIWKKIKRESKDIYEVIMMPNMAFIPGSIAFFLVLSIFPLLTMIAAIASMFSLDIGSLSSIINTAFPDKVADVLLNYVSTKGLTTNLAIFMIIGFFYASNGAHSIILASNNMYGFPNASYISRRIKAIFVIILLILLLFFMLGILAFGNKILQFILLYVKDEEFSKLIFQVFVTIKWPIATFFIYFIVKVIYTMAPDWRILSKHTTKGALFTTITWIILMAIYSFWINNFANYDIFYGSLSNLAILMLIMYFLAFIFVIGIGINVKTYEYKIKD